MRHKNQEVVNITSQDVTFQIAESAKDVETITLEPGGTCMLPAAYASPLKHGEGDLRPSVIAQLTNHRVVATTDPRAAAVMKAKGATSQEATTKGAAKKAS